MIGDESVPTWFVVLMILAGIAGVAVIVYARFESGRYALAPKTRKYPQTPDIVAAAARAAIERLQYGIYSVDEHSISVSFKAMFSEGVAIAPVVHLVMLPTNSGGTQVEVVGGRGPGHYSWHVIAQSLLSELDRRLTTARSA